MTENSLTLAIVIPIYNEERYLKQCLDAISRQTVAPDEVIVVDNNSTDRSAEIAAGYDFVTLIREPRQHQVFAQAAGFNYAKSDILGRIDADTFLPKTWVERVKTAFGKQPDTFALTGDADPYDVYFKRISLFVVHTYYRLADTLAGHKLLWGANMAIRRTAWQKVKTKVRMKGDIWEDYDLAFCVAEVFGKRSIAYQPGIKAGMSFRAIHMNLIRQVRYHLRAPRTFYLRAGVAKAAIFMIILTFGSLLLVYPLTVLDLIMATLTGRRLDD